MTATLQQRHITVVGEGDDPTALAGLRDELGPGISLSTATPDSLTDHLTDTDCVLVDRRRLPDAWEDVVARATDRSPAPAVVVLLPEDAGAAGVAESGATDYLRASVCESRPSFVADHLTRLADTASECRGDRDGVGLPETERWFTLITETVEEIIYVANADFSDVKFVSPGYEEVWGRLVEQLYEDATAFIDGIDPRDRDEFRADFEAMRDDIRAGDPDDQYEFEFRVRQPDGERRWVHATGYPVETATGEDGYVGIAEDVTERKEAETRFQTIVERIDAAVMLVPEGETEPAYLNPVYEDLTGIPVADLYDPETFVDHIHPEDREGYVADVGAMVEDILSGDPRDRYEFEFRFQRPDGETRWFHWTGYPLVDEDNEYWYIGVTTDITERRRRQEQIRENERTFREIFNKSSAAITVHDPETTEMVAVNDTMCELLGRDRETILDLDIGGVSVTDEGYTQARGAEIIDRIMTSGEPEEYEWVIEDADGERRVMLVTGTPAVINGEDRLLATSQDITERKRREQAVEEERQKYSTLVEQSTDGVAVIRDGEYVFVNEQFAEITGYDEAELLGRPFHTVFTPEDSDLVSERYEARIAGESPPNQYDVEAERADGQRVTLELSVSRIQHEGEPATLANFRDVTERRQRERAVEQLQAATERFQQADTAEDVYEITVETARDALGMPLSTCWRYDRPADRLESAAATEAVADLDWTPGPFAPGDPEYDLFERSDPTTYEPGRHRDGSPVDAAIAVPIGDYGLLGAGELGRSEYEPYLVDLLGVLGSHARSALDRVDRARALRESERRLQAIIDRIDEAIFFAPVSELTEPDPAPDFVSSGYEEIWGQSLEGLHETYDEGFFGTLHSDDRDEYVAFLEGLTDDVAAGDANRRYTHEYRIERPDGTVRWVHSDYYPTAWGDDVPRVVIVSRDITARKRRERTLESFQDATAELTTAETVPEAGRTAVEAAAEVFDLPATAIYHYDEERSVLTPTATGPEGPDAADLQPLDAGATEVWETFIGETMRRVAPAERSALGAGPGEEALLFPLGGNGVLVVWEDEDALDADAASILAATLEAALNRLRGERQLQSRREELEAQSERARRLEAIAELTQRVDAAITTQSSREGIREAVCSELTEVAPFTAAWIAGAEVGTDRLTPRTVSGIDRAAVDQLLSHPDTVSAPQHPVVDAWQSGDPCTVDNLVGSGRGDEWRRILLREGISALCAVPVAYSGITYGVLTVVAEDPGAFGDREVEVLAQLGTSVGYAITALERQRALESDDTLELEFRGTDLDIPPARLAAAAGCRVSHERTVRRPDGSVSVYYSLAGDLPAEPAETAGRVLPGEVEVVSRQADRLLVERRGSSWFGAVVSESGGVLRRGEATDGEVTLVVELPQETDTRTIVDRLRSEFAGLELIAQRQRRETAVTPTAVHDRLEQRLSDRQYEALQTAHTMGYFDWPRESSGEDVAERLGITQPTVNKHIRLGERKVFDMLFAATSG